MMLLLSVALAASPMTVRVLEREKPERAKLDATAVTCDGEALGKSVEVRVGVHEVMAGERPCTEVRAEGATVSLPDASLTRRYPGTVKVTLEGSFLKLVNEVDVEDYLPSVVEAELGGSKAAALEAQAVVSRTFALASHKRHGNAGYDLCDLAHCQVYRGAADVSEASRAAVMKTKGQVLLTGSVALKPTYFHAACGGHTSRAQEVFGDEEFGEGVSDVEKGSPRCHEAPDFAWTYTVDRPTLAEALGYRDDGTATPLEVLRRDEGGRVIVLRAYGHRLTAGEFLSKVGRNLGWGVLKSARFTAQEVDGTMHFTGTGIGHGVGLCQAGTKWLAEHGVDSPGILKRYFPGTRLAPAPVP